MRRLRLLLLVVLLIVTYSFVQVDLTAVCTALSDEDGNALLLPDEKNCTRFYICDKNVPYLHNCSDGLIFHPKLKVCARYSTVMKDVFEDYCEWDDDLYMKPHFCDCTKYVICSYGTPEEGECNRGEYFKSLKGEARIPLSSLTDLSSVNVCWEGKCDE